MAVGVDMDVAGFGRLQFVAAGGENEIVTRAIVESGQRMAAAGEFGAPLQNIINAYVYGDVWERTGLSNDIRSLVMLGITAASNKPAEFRVHAKGALANGCTKEQVQDVLLLVAMYCGVPAAIETNRIAAEIFGALPERKASPTAMSQE